MQLFLYVVSSFVISLWCDFIVCVSLWVSLVRSIVMYVLFYVVISLLRSFSISFVIQVQFVQLLCRPFCIELVRQVCISFRLYIVISLVRSSLFRYFVRFCLFAMCVIQLVRYVCMLFLSLSVMYVFIYVLISFVRFGMSLCIPCLSLQFVSQFVFYIARYFVFLYVVHVLYSQ